MLFLELYIVLSSLKIHEEPLRNPWGAKYLVSLLITSLHLLSGSKHKIKHSLSGAWSFQSQLKQAHCNGDEYLQHGKRFESVKESRGAEWHCGAEACQCPANVFAHEEKQTDHLSVYLSKESSPSPSQRQLKLKEVMAVSHHLALYRYPHIPQEIHL